MSSLMLNSSEMKNLNNVVCKLESINGSDVYFVAPVVSNACDKYDCWFGPLKCTCQGNCDGRN